MARPLRLEFAGAHYHITSRGNERRDIFRDDADRLLFLSLLAKAVQRFKWSLFTFTLMTNHYHLVLQTPLPNLSRGMQWLNGAYATAFNRRHKRCGHLFQGRFHALLIEKEAYLAQVLRYVALNAVRAGMVERPEDYAWSSYRAIAGLEAAPEWLDLSAALAAFGAGESEAQAEYRAFVLAGVGAEDRLWTNLRNSIYLGTEAWRREMREIVESRPRSTDHP
ncbi:MAG TPA: transposase, partial [Thermoanaerobaculia bacterium]